MQATPQGQFVYVVGAENKVAPQPIKTAGFSGQDWVVIDGLTGGERIVVDGIQKIRPGAVVNPVVAGAAAAKSDAAGEQTRAQPPAAASDVASAAPKQKPSASVGAEPAVAAER